MRQRSSSCFWDSARPGTIPVSELVLKHCRAPSTSVGRAVWKCIIRSGGLSDGIVPRREPSNSLRLRLLELCCVPRMYQLLFVGRSAYIASWAKYLGHDLICSDCSIMVGCPDRFWTESCITDPDCSLLPERHIGQCRLAPMPKHTNVTITATGAGRNKESKNA